MVADIIPEHTGLECFASEDPKAGSNDKYMLSAKGEYLAKNDGVPDCRNWIYWDDDLLRETFSGNRKITSKPYSIVKYTGESLKSNIEGRIIMMADILGDWREELITALPGEIRIYTTNIPAKDKRSCLMLDRVYRIEVAHRSMGYEQSPVTSYYLGKK
jgi:rhamnogalacturonan endolyase